MLPQVFKRVICFLSLQIISARSCALCEVENTNIHHQTIAPWPHHHPQVCGYIVHPGFLIETPNNSWIKTIYFMSSIQLWVLTVTISLYSLTVSVYQVYQHCVCSCTNFLLFMKSTAMCTGVHNHGALSALLRPATFFSIVQPPDPLTYWSPRHPFNIRWTCHHHQLLISHIPSWLFLSQLLKLLCFDMFDSNLFVRFFR